MPEGEGEFIEGIDTQKDGRETGQEGFEVGSVEIFNPGTGKLHIVRKNAVIENSFNALRKETGGDYTFCRLTYKGKKESTSGNSYHNFELQKATATQEEIDKLAEFEASQG